MDLPGTVDGNYVNYSGFVYYNNTNGDFDTTFNGDTVNGAISTYYLNHDFTDGTTNQLNISNSLIHGSITSMLPMVKAVMVIMYISSLNTVLIA